MATSADAGPEPPPNDTYRAGRNELDVSNSRDAGRVKCNANVRRSHFAALAARTWRGHQFVDKTVRSGSETTPPFVADSGPRSLPSSFKMWMDDGSEGKSALSAVRDLDSRGHNWVRPDD